MKPSIFSAIAISVAALTTAVPTMAQDNATEPTQRLVRYDDLNLASASGRARLETRLRMAANSACGISIAREPAERARARQCRDAALEKARPQMEQAVRDAGSMLAGRVR